MADDIDKAQDAAAINLADAIERQRIQAMQGPRLHPAGHCRNPLCGEPFAANDNRLFCNAKCATEHGRARRN